MVSGRLPFTLGILVSLGCGSAPAMPAEPARPSGPERIPLRYDRHLPSLPVRIDGDVDARFAFDTGIGINLISKSLCKMVSCVGAGEYVGRRMSGQAVTVPLARIRSLAVGGEEQRDVVVGIIDLENFTEAKDVQGFVSLGLFTRRAITLDERASELVLETPESLERRLSVGTATPVKVRREGPSVTAFLPLEVSGQRILAQVDTGSDALILDERFMSLLGVDKAGAKVVEGHDETGQSFTRWFTELQADVHPAGVSATRRSGTRTMFQSIIHDGLVGRVFLEPWTVTFDLPHGRMVFAKATPK